MMKNKGIILIAGIVVAMMLAPSVAANDPNDWTIGGNGFGGGTTQNLGTTSSDGLAFITNNVARMTITSSGTVGIGVASPSYMLDVMATSSIGSVTFTGSGLNDMSNSGTFTGATALNYKIEIDSTGTPDTFKWSDNGGTSWQATSVAITGANQLLNYGVNIRFAATTGHTLNDIWLFSTTVTNPFSVQNAAGTRAFYIGNDGFVAVGTVSPAVKFHVEEEDPPTLSANSFYEVGRIGVKDAVTPSHNAIGMGVFDSNGYPAIQSIDEDNGPPSEQSVPLYINPIGGDVLMVKNWATMGGKVGIGTTSPDELLHVAESAKIEEGIQLGTPSSISAMLQIEHTGYTYPLRITDDGDSPTFFVVDGDGDVGIGVTTPDTELCVDGAITLDEQGTAPGAPATDDQVRIYVKNDKLIVWADDSGDKWWYLDLNSASDQYWKYTASSP